MKDCIFCKIANGEIESVKIWEDKDFFAILDVNPNTKGMTLVLTKNIILPMLLKCPTSYTQNLCWPPKKSLGF
jgi:histidine triad (HIT) family protein